ncbi:hypothetical protein R1flu_013509 [Riccia fluitans]|uniref:F-box domain-containing protein n=1 Tax=Riccia fluitans TaxID=41844 RepID=A0ABD1YDS2_9MARC
METSASLKGMMDLLDDDTITHILKNLSAPADIANATIVSRSWRQHVLEGQLWKNLCHSEFPELRFIDEVIEIDISRGLEGAGTSCVYQSTLEKNHRVYNQLYRGIMKTERNSERNCISSALYASSTDKFPQESIHETLVPHPKRHRDIHEMNGWSYWSSKGHKNPEEPETLTYKLNSPLCLIEEVKIRPFKADWQFEHPIYSSRYVRFRLGYETPRPSRSEDVLSTDTDGSKPLEFPWKPGPPPQYTWTYVSSEFTMEQRDVLQVFKLPQPVLCMGQIFQVELLGRAQTQLQDLLYYICICHVKVVGKPIKNFGFSPLSAGGSCGLICQRAFHSAAVTSPSSDPTEHLALEEEDTVAPNGGGGHNFAENIRQLRLSRGLWHFSRETSYNSAASCRHM